MCKPTHQKEITDLDKEAKLSLEEKISSNRTIWTNRNLNRVEREKVEMTACRIHWGKVEVQQRRKK
jgi:hypothetical protein